ncbi:uncharacterized protein [Amphiura filiformis]|uniref:uncharacterized protein isoform X2 n=1 Tax=Amphiura filiformis TaxID=82378 RepID=UPI003B218551
MKTKHLYFTLTFACFLPLLQSKYLKAGAENNDVRFRPKLGRQFGFGSLKNDLNVSLPNFDQAARVGNSDVGRRISWSVLQQKLEIARINTDTDSYHGNMYKNKVLIKDFKQSKISLEVADTPGPLDPYQPAQPFILDTLDGPVKYPSQLLPNNSNTPIIFHTFNNHSAFSECLWTSDESLQALVLNSPANVRYVFMTTGEDGHGDAVWMHGQIKSTMLDLVKTNQIKFNQGSDLLSRMFFVTTPVYELGNYISTVLMEWACAGGHGCGLDQAKFTNTSSAESAPIILKRLDAHYDWLPSPDSTFEDQSKRVVLSHDGCTKNPHVADAIAMVVDGNCDFYQKVNIMEQSKAIGVIVYAQPGQPVQDMNCQDDECDLPPPSIPATYIPYNEDLINMLQSSDPSVNVTFQHTASSNFYMAIDSQGLLAQMGWLLYPTFQFFVWQAEWFNFKTSLQANMTDKALMLPVVNASIMQGETGIIRTVKMPKLTEIQKYKKVELDAYLSCPGTTDGTCPPWDHIMSLYVCCDNTSALCGMELGRWITPFRRRIGHWLTNITPLIPLLTSDTCTFTMKLDAWWAEPWKPSLNIRFSEYNRNPDASDMYPYKVVPLFQGGTFNKSYNTQYKPIDFTVPTQVSKVEIVAIITGHGSDENGCGEFCPTSHHFVVNAKHENVKNFSTAGTLLGCAVGKPITGVEPNEHGTWLYGRNGWCNGRQVDPWVIDITMQLDSQSNNVTYYGWYQGTDPDPKEEPGYIVMYSYLVYYKNFS